MHGTHGCALSRGVIHKGKWDSTDASYSRRYLSMLLDSSVESTKPVGRVPGMNRARVDKSGSPAPASVESPGPESRGSRADRSSQRRVLGRRPYPTVSRGVSRVPCRPWACVGTPGLDSTFVSLDAK